MGDRIPVRYTRAGLPGATYDLKTFDLGNLHVFTDGVEASANLGLLEVTYSVDLFTPQIQDGVAGTTQATADLSSVALVGSNFAAADPQSLLPFSRTSNAVLTFNQRFEGMIGYLIQGVGLAADFAPGAAGGDASNMGVALVNAAGTAVVGLLRVRAVPGTTLTPTITVTGGVTGVQYFVARGSYTQFGA